MPSVHYADQSFAVRSGETVLDCLLRNGILVPHSCKAGACQSCLLKAAPGSLLSEASTRGLKETLRAQGYFLSCSQQPAADLNVSLADDALRIRANIQEIAPLSGSVLRLRLRTESPLDYFAGQFVTLVRHDGLARSYSLASLPSEDTLELHIRRIRGGAMSEWIHNVAALQTAITLRGPHGNCFYVPGKPTEPLILAGTGTGLAPLYGILRDALRHRHTGPIYLFHGAINPNGLYLVNEINDIVRAHPNVSFLSSVLQPDSACDAYLGPLDDCISAKLPKLAGWKGYLCGDPTLVNSLRKQFFLAGMASKAIHADPFVPSAPASL